LAPEPDFDKIIVTPHFEFHDRTAGGPLGPEFGRSEQLFRARGAQPETFDLPAVWLHQPISPGRVVSCWAKGDSAFMGQQMIAGKENSC
jgi:hypothetical protein